MISIHDRTWKVFHEDAWRALLSIFLLPSSLHLWVRYLSERHQTKRKGGLCRGHDRLPALLPDDQSVGHAALWITQKPWALRARPSQLGYWLEITTNLQSTYSSHFPFQSRTKSVFVVPYVFQHQACWHQPHLPRLPQQESSAWPIHNTEAWITVGRWLQGKPHCQPHAVMVSRKTQMPRGRYEKRESRFVQQTMPFDPSLCFLAIQWSEHGRAEDFLSIAQDGPWR